MQAPGAILCDGRGGHRRPVRREPSRACRAPPSTTPHGDLRPTRGEHNVIHARYAK
ncbi:hypothetical protein BURMUCF2_B0299 [Burkholderia multivorans CF2]|nr:hypothetical protein BURMUCF2_B0299 [Burkholderia multivorans CF2]